MPLALSRLRWVIFHKPLVRLCLLYIKIDRKIFIGVITVRGEVVVVVMPKSMLEESLKRED